MELSVAENHLRKLASLLGVVQGLGYGIMALMCIIMYNRDPPLFDINSYMGTVNYYMYYLFLGPNVHQFSDQTLYPKVFTVFAWVYFILSCAWLGASVDVWFKKGVVLPRHLTAWSHLTLLISLWDFITVVILGADYHKCLKWANQYQWINDYKIEYESICANGILPPLVIAARGFVLWIINVHVALVINKISLRLKKGVIAQVQQAQTMQPSVDRPIVYPVQQPMPQQNVYVAQPTLYAQYSAPATSNYNRNQYEYQIPVPVPEPDYYNQPSPRLKKY